MGRSRRNKIHLSAEQRQRFEEVSRNGYAPTKKILHAQILLMSDEGEFASVVPALIGLKKFASC